ncbi:MAG: DUF3105 domain-containing protein [Chloroflexota bacterium]|nr:DUF3105 domain-containing protein [Chloroflexota bacterium]
MAVATRRERREQEKRRQQRRKGARTTRPARRGGGLVIGAVLVGVMILAIVAARAAGVFDPPAKAIDVSSAENQPVGDVGQKIADLGNAHIPVGQHATYNSVPPTSGEHYAAPAAPAPAGVKDSTLPNEVTTHNLEHGGIIIVYNNLAPADLDQLKSLYRSLSNAGYRKILVEPYPTLSDAKIAVTAWDWILKLPGYEQSQIIKFVRAHYDGKEAPEAGASW